MIKVSANPNVEHLNLTSKRCAGVLLHISSLPMADFGVDATRFVDFLAEVGASIWQTLPLNMPHDDGSPYQCLSAHAGNPAFINLQILVEQNLLSGDDLRLNKHSLQAQALSLPDSPSEFASTYLKANRHAALAKAYFNYKHYQNTALQKEFGVFCRQNSAWLGDFALFLVLREKFKHASWSDWPTAYKNKQPAVIASVKQRYAHEIAVIKFTQFLFFRQWHALKTYANQKGIAMFGDIPIFVAYDSADVWAKPQLFKLDSHKNMQVVAGVPPDYFSETGQRWGNPHYNWPVMQATGFSWWKRRILTQQRMFDLVRIDHFRGIQSAWEIPAADETAINGTWALAPGDDLLRVLRKQFPALQLIAEDLGIITPEVDALRKKHHLPGMKILQFAFGGDDSNPYLPANIEPNSVVYTGTHDNDTSLGWYQSTDDNAKNHLHALLKTTSPNMPQDLITLAMSSNADMAIIPMQDILGLDAKHRMNTPGTIVGNWQWQFDWNALSDNKRQLFKDAIVQSMRA
ncbi:MAG: 4-alpha-glucanotransferase [Bdellovibrio sp.]|nr:4-alpha-glucanotransferase [Methylotenera sp.]